MAPAGIVKITPDVSGFAEAVRLALIKALLGQALALLDSDSTAWSLVDRAVANIVDYEATRDSS